MLSVLSMMECHLKEEDDDEVHLPHQDDDDNSQDALPLSKAELRKSNKPIMEKRRRARINTCLNELKSLILDAMKKDPARHSKLEKADILEMTVKHLQAVQRQQLALAVAHDPGVLTKFRSGFTECAQEVTRYVSRIEGVDGGVRQRLMQHLGQCVSGLTAMTPLSFTALAGLPMPLAHLQNNVPPPAHHPPVQQTPGDVNNNQARLLHGLVAARLAAAGDTTGAALLLHGGLSLLARAAPHAPPANQSAGAPPQGAASTGVTLQNVSQQPPVLHGPTVKVNEGASSSGERPIRPSAFTAVKRSSSPPRVPLEVHRRPQEGLATAPSQPQQQLVAPTARRLTSLVESHPETVVRAQVAVQPVNLSLSTSRDNEGRAPLDFSTGKRSLNRPVLTVSTSKHSMYSESSQLLIASHSVSSQPLPLTASTQPTTTYPTPIQSTVMVSTSTQPTHVHPIPKQITPLHPTPTHPVCSQPTPIHSAPAHNTLTHHPISHPSMKIATASETHQQTHTHQPLQMKPQYTLKPQAIHSLPHKRPLEESEVEVTNPAKIPRLETSPAGPSAPRNLTPPHQQFSSSTSSPEEASVATEPHLEVASPHTKSPPSCPSQAGQSSPTEGVKSDDTNSPDRSSAAVPHEDKDMWRPW